MDLRLAVFLSAPLANAFSLPWSSLTSDCTASRARTLSARDTNTTVIPAAISWNPSQYWDGIDGPWSSFALQVGNHAQTVRVMPGTAAATTLTVNALGCPSEFGNLQSCEDSRGSIFLSNESNTWTPNSIYNIGIEKNLGLDITGAETGFDTVTLGYNGEKGPTVNHTIIQSFAVTNFWLGIFGLRADPSNFTTLNDPNLSYMQSLVNQNSIPSLSYGYTAGAKYRLTGIYGSLTFGGYDQNRFDKNQSISVGMYPDNNRDLLVSLQGITTDSGSPSNLLPDGAISIFIDSTVAQLWLPQSACEAFEQAFGLQWDDTYQYYTVNTSLHNSLLERNANVTFTLGGQLSGGPTTDIVFPYGAFNLNLTFPYITDPDSSYYFPLKRAANESQYTLGRAFLQETYLIVDYDHANFSIAPCIWDSETISQRSLVSILRANETQSIGHGDSETNVGAIAGGVVGGVLGLALIAALVIFFLRRKKQAEKKRLAELEAKTPGAADSDAGAADSAKPVISAPIGGELGGEGEIHEMNAPHKSNAQELDTPNKHDPSQRGYSEMEAGSYFAPGKDGRVAEMEGATPIYEMAGSDVNEMSAAAAATHRAPAPATDESTHTSK